MYKTSLAIQIFLKCKICVSSALELQLIYGNPSKGLIIQVRNGGGLSFPPSEESSKLVSYSNIDPA